MSKINLDAYQKRASQFRIAQPQRRRPATIVFVLTRICYVRHIQNMEYTFTAIAEPKRRAILSLLASSELSVGDIEERLRLSQPSVSKHLRVLREAGVVESRIDAQRRVYRIRPEPLMEVDAWLDPFRRLWSAHVDSLERHLDRANPAPTRKRKRA